VLLYQEEFFVPEIPETIIELFDPKDKNKKSSDNSNNKKEETSQLNQFFINFFANLLLNLKDFNSKNHENRLLSKEIAPENQDKNSEINSPEEEIKTLSPEQTILFDSLSELAIILSDDTQHSPLFILETKIRSELKKIAKKIKAKDTLLKDNLNPKLWQQQIKKIEKSYQNIEEKETAIRKIILDDINFYIKEFIIKKYQDQFVLQNFKNSISTGSYAHTDLTESVENFRKIKTLEGKLDRPSLDAFVYGEFLEGWFQTAPIGQRMMIISPPGEVSEGYIGSDSYSFVYLYQIEKNPENNEKIIKVDMFRQWFDEKDGLQLLQQLATQEQKIKLKNFEEINKKQLMVSATIIDEKISNQEIEQILFKLYQEKTAKKDLEKRLDPKFKQDSLEIFDKFLYPELKSFYDNKIVSKKDWKSIHLLLSIWERKIFDKVSEHNLDRDPSLKTSNKNAADITRMERTLELIKKGKVSEAEKVEYINLLNLIFANTGGYIGAGQRIMSLTSCGLGTIPSLAIKTAQGMTKINIKDAYYNPSLLPKDLQLDYHGKYICKLCGSFIDKPGFCPNCGQLNADQFVQFKASNEALRMRNEFGNNNGNNGMDLLSKNKNIKTKNFTNTNHQSSESVGDFVDTLLGKQNSISFSQTLFSTN
jgi:rubrerythrin